MPEIASLFATAKEELIPIDGRNKGVIPNWLEGRLMRNGPGIFDLDDFAITHFFDGFSMISKFEIKDGKVSYSQKRLESEACERFLLARRPVFAEFGTKAYPDPTKGFLHRMFSTLVPTDLTDNNATAMYCIENDIFAASETCYVHSINPDTLDKKDRVDLNKIAGTMFISAHPLTDSEGTIWNIGSSMLTGCKYHVIKISPNGISGIEALKEAKVVATIPSSWKTCLSYIHSFQITENYIILMEQPLLINCMKLAQIGIKGKALKDTFEWTPTEKNRIHIIEKDTGNVIKTKFITEDPYFVLHNINAFEREEQIILDVVAYPEPSMLEKFTLESLRQNEFPSNDPSQTYRFVIPLVRFVQDITEDENLVTVPEFDGCAAVRKGDAVILLPKKIAEPGLELPTINPRYVGRHHRFFYASGTYDCGYYKNSACKIDTETGKIVLYKTGSRSEYCGEPTFIPKPDDNTDEDDGIVLIPVSSGDISKPDYLAILDSKSFQELARAEFDLKFVQCFHGTFVPLL